MKSFKRLRNQIERSARVALWPSELPSSVDEHYFSTAEKFLVEDAHNYRILLTENSDRLPFHERVDITRKMHPKYSRMISDSYSLEQLPLIIEDLVKDDYKRLTILVPYGYMESTQEVIGSLNTVLVCEIIESRFDYTSSPIYSAAESSNLRKFVECLPESYSDAVSYFNAVVTTQQPVEKTTVDIFREMYVRGEIFNVGDSILSEAGDVLRVVAKKPNFVVCENAAGDQSKHWVTKILPISFDEAYTPEEFDPLIEKVTQKELDDIATFANRLLSKLEKPIKFKFDGHFIQRANDDRSIDPIVQPELMRFIRKMKKYIKGGDFYPNKENELVMRDLTTDINIPFIIKHIDGEWVMVAKTVMRKTDFRSTNRIILMESVVLSLDEGKAKKGKKSEVSKPRYHIDWNTGSRSHRVKKGKGSYSRKGKKDYRDE